MAERDYQALLEIRIKYGERKTVVYTFTCPTNYNHSFSFMLMKPSGNIPISECEADGVVRTSVRCPNQDSTMKEFYALHITGSNATDGATVTCRLYNNSADNNMPCGVGNFKVIVYRGKCKQYHGDVSSIIINYRFRSYYNYD